MRRIYFFKSIFLSGLFSCSNSFADSATYLKCYNEIHAPLPPVNVFGVPVLVPVTVPGLKLSPHFSQLRNSTAVSAYLVTSKTILKKTFDHSTAQDIGIEQNPIGGGQIHISGSPVFEIDPLYTGVPTRIFVRARWTSTLDHPNGAHLYITEEFRDKGKAKRKPSQNEQIIDNVRLTSESRAQVIEYLKKRIESTALSKQASTNAYDACYSIPELKGAMDSKMSSLRSKPISQPIPAGLAPANMAQ